MAERTALILGATSDIARAIALNLAEQGYALQLSARDSAKLEREAADLKLRTENPVTWHLLDILDVGQHAPFLELLDPLPDVAICVVGFMGDHAENIRDPGAAERVMATNYTAPAKLLGALANCFAARDWGTIVGISSVAGERGRASNYIYGSAKAGFTAFLSGLRQRFAGTGVRVMTVKLGYVRTRITENLDLPGLLTAEPPAVAHAVTKAIQKRRDVVYILPVWRALMMIIRTIPEPLFKRLNI